MVRIFQPVLKDYTLRRVLALEFNKLFLFPCTLTSAMEPIPIGRSEREDYDDSL